MAAYLHRDVREVGKLASRGHLPGHKVGGEWRFARVEINHWLETQMSGLDEQQLVALEKGGHAAASSEPLLSSLLSEASIAVPLPASTKASVLKELVNLAEQTWQVYDPQAVLEAIRQREELGSTALPSGVAIPHPRRPLPSAIGESLIAYGRTASPHAVRCAERRSDGYFLPGLLRDDRTHLKVLARLTRLLLRPGFLEDLRATETPAETWRKIHDAELALAVPLRRT